METRIIQCTCEHKFQDKKYGKKSRVFNKASGKEKLWRCTVCKKEVVN